MFPDSPVTDSSQDRFNRLPFARRIADALSSRLDPTSIVIGIYGAWGQGKTTVLNFIEQSLQENSHIICIRFNPWLFKNEEQLIRSFFELLASKLDSSITNRREKIGGLLSKYSAYLAPIDVGLSIAGLPGPSEALQKVGDALSGIDLETIKGRVEELLADAKKRVVILMDDIDRLDKTEIQSIFRLVKLSADFKYTAYVLAFDEEMVAAAIAERYGSGEIDAGRKFLEKIVQVPLSLPEADELALREFCFECVDEALRGAEIDLTEDEARRFARYFTDGLEAQLKTPRMAKRYGNILAFSLPLLKGEANMVDLLLIEGIKVFQPNLYEAIKNNPDFFQGTVIDRYRDNEQIKKIASEILDPELVRLSKDARKSTEKLLKELFPRLNGILGNSHYGSDWQTRWTKEKRIASTHYFSRYFSYSVPRNDISDQEIELFLNKLEDGAISEIANELKRLVSSGGTNADAFITKIFRERG